MTEHFPAGPDELGDEVFDPREGQDLEAGQPGDELVQEGNVDGTDDGDEGAPVPV